MSDDTPIKRWTAKRKASVVMDIFKGKTTVAEVARQHDLTVSEVEGGIGEAQRNMENGGKARPKDIREQYESGLRETKEALGETHLQIYALKMASPARRGRELVRSLQAEMASKAVWYHLPNFASRHLPNCGYRRLTCVLGENHKPVQRILKLNNWQVRKRPEVFRHAKNLPPITPRSDERWATDLTNVWCGKDRRASVAVIIDCCMREIGWRLSDNGSSKTAEAALEEALVYRLGALGRVQQPLALRSDNGLVFSIRHYTRAR